MFRPLTVLIGLLALPGGALAQEREWQFDTNGTEAYLVFGVPQSDDAGIGFWCAMNSGEIRIFVPEAAGALKPGAKVELDFEAGGGRFSYDASVETNEESGVPAATASSSTADGLYAALKHEDRFKLVVGKHQTVYPLMSADVSALLRVCAKS